MEGFHGKSKTKSSGSGGKKRGFRHVKRYESGRAFTATKVSENDERKVIVGRGNTVKVKLKKAAFANIVVKGKAKKAKIRTVVESPANRHYARGNILTKGTIIDTELGKARITNRVGQDGVVNAVLLEGQK